MTVLLFVAEVAIGVLHAVGAVFNTVYTMRHPTELYGSFADGAWLAPARSFVHNVVLPHARLFTIVLIVFQGTIAVAILTRGMFVTPALVAGGIFALVVALFSSPAGTVGNLVLAAIQFALVFLS